MQNLRTRRLRYTLGGGPRSFSLALTLLTPLVFLGCTQDPVVKKQQHVERGSRFLEEGKYNEAVIELKNALQLDPTFVPALHALGRAYYAKGWYLDAARELSRAAEREAGAIPIRLLLGQSFLAVGDSNKAEEQAEAIRRIEPDSPLVNYLARSRPDREGRSQRSRRAARARTGQCGRHSRDASGVWRCLDPGTAGWTRPRPRTGPRSGVNPRLTGAQVGLARILLRQGKSEEAAKLLDGGKAGEPGQSPGSPRPQRAAER